jgi:hypothetical protein
MFNRLFGAWAIGAVLIGLAQATPGWAPAE